MHQPNSSPDGSDPWKAWVDHWRFSNYTGFRIPEYLASVLGAWRQVSQILLDATQAPEPIHFFRHPLLPEDKEARTEARDASPLVQFTQSSILSGLLTPSSDSAKSANPRSIFKKKAENLQRSLNKEHWLDLIDAINEHPGSNFSGSEFDTELLKSFPDKLPADKELPQLFHQLFLAFSSINHKGFIQHSLNCHHLSLEPVHREEIVGYLVATENKKRSLPDIRSISEIRLDRKNKVSSFVRNRKQKEPFDILDAHRDGDFSSLLLSLWQTLNLESTRADKNLYLAVPVYAWSESPTDDYLLKSSRARGGALLGWALHRCPEEITPRKFNALYQHVRSLCFMMEDFAINYLAGETEWALDRKWENGDTPETFMKRNFHHSCGWTCNTVEEGNMEEYFQWGEQRETGKSRLMVNLTRRLETIVPYNDLSKIAYLSPNSLCLEPSGGKERDSYRASVAENARHFYNRCLAIAEQRKKAELAGRVSVSHSLQFAVSVQLEKMQGVADAIHSLRSSQESFPISSFAQLPDELRRFHYPVELYSTAVLNALEQDSGSHGFARLIPVVDWMDEAIEIDGFKESFIRKLANDVARPLARISLRRRGHNREPLGELNIQGCLPQSELSMEASHENAVLEGRILIAAIAEGLREAYHHCGGNNPRVTVTLQSGNDTHIRISNTFLPASNDASLTNGNQGQAFSRFQRHLPSWIIARPHQGDGNWIREFTRLPKQT